jgi:hypothetical protein
VLAAVPAADIPDERLAMMFACAHPAIDPGIRAPMILQAVLGLDAVRIASAFLTSPAAMGKRLVRAKVKIRQAGIPFPRARSFQPAWTQSSTPSTPHSPRVGPIPAAPMSSAAISPKKPSILPVS